MSSKSITVSAHDLLVRHSFCMDIHVAGIEPAMFVVCIELCGSKLNAEKY